jgi:hypothetical protein
VLAATCTGFADIWGERRSLLADAGAIGMQRVISVARERDEEPLRLELVKHVERALSSGELCSVLPAQMLADVFLLDVFAALMAWAHTGAPALDVVMPAVIELFLRGAEGFGSPRTAAGNRTRARKRAVPTRKSAQRR